MLYSTRSSIFDYELVHSEIQGSPLYDNTQDLISDVTKYDDRITQIIEYGQHELLNNNLSVVLKLSNTWPTYFYILKKEGVVGLQLNIDSHRMFLRELVASSLVCYPWLLAHLKRKTKDTTLISFASSVLSKLMYTVNRRPVQEDVFLSRCLVYTTGHYLKLATNNVSLSTLYKELSKNLTVTRVVKEEVSQYMKANEELLQSTNYNGKLFLKSLCDNVLNSTYDLVLSQLISKFGTDVCVSFDEPSYLVYNVVTGKLFKTNTLHNYVQSGMLSRMLSFVLSFSKR